jgi:hypothetical protein
MRSPQVAERGAVTRGNMDTADSLFSSYRERVLEHQLIGEILRDLWQRGAHQVEVLRSEVDGAGYDVVLEYKSVVRHIQLKATRAGGKRGSIGVNVKLADKPNGCVIWVHFSPTLILVPPFYWFGATPGSRLPDLGKKVGRHTKGDATGKKGLRQSIRTIGKGRFDRVQSIAELVTLLFNVGPRTTG